MILDVPIVTTCSSGCSEDVERTSPMTGGAVRNRDSSVHSWFEAPHAMPLPSRNKF